MRSIEETQLEEEDDDDDDLTPIGENGVPQFERNEGEEGD